MGSWTHTSTCFCSHVLFLVSKSMENFRGVWFGCFLFSFLLKTENSDENVFGWIFKMKQPENENNKISFSVF